jgi:hypothetical protein
MMNAAMTGTPTTTLMAGASAQRGETYAGRFRRSGKRAGDKRDKAHDFSFRILPVRIHLEFRSPIKSTGRPSFGAILQILAGSHCRDRDLDLNQVRSDKSSETQK